METSALREKLHALIDSSSLEKFCPGGVSLAASAIARGPRHSATRAIFNLVLHNVQEQIRLFCFSHKTLNCCTRNLPNVPPASIFHERNSGVCNLFFVTKTVGDILALHQNCLQILCAFAPS